jgi:GNAT superfamily N-acetyltransferase
MYIDVRKFQYLTAAELDDLSKLSRDSDSWLARLASGDMPTERTDDLLVARAWSFESEWQTPPRGWATAHLTMMKKQGAQHPELCFEYNICVHRSSRRTGVGKLLILALQKRTIPVCRGHIAFPGDAKAKRFYEEVGIEPVRGKWTELTPLDTPDGYW